MKAYKRLFFGVLTVVFLLSGCGATVTAGLLKSKIGFIGETGKNNMKLYDEFKDWERQVSAPVAVVDEGIYLKRKGEVQQLSCGKNDLVWESEIAAIYNGRIYYVAPSSTVMTTTVNFGVSNGCNKGFYSYLALFRGFGNLSQKRRSQVVVFCFADQFTRP